MNTVDASLVLFLMPELVCLIMSFLDERLLFKQSQVSKLWQAMALRAIRECLYEKSYCPSLSYNQVYEKKLRGLIVEMDGDKKLASKCLSLLGPSLFSSHRFTRIEDRITVIHLTGSAYLRKWHFEKYLTHRCFDRFNVKKISIHFEDNNHFNNEWFSHVPVMDENKLVEQLHDACLSTIEASLIVMVVNNVEYAEKNGLFYKLNELLVSGKFITDDGVVFEIPRNYNLICLLKSKEGVQLYDDYEKVVFSAFDTNKVNFPSGRRLYKIKKTLFKL